MDVLKYLTRRGLMDKELAAEVGCDRSTVTKIKLGIARPSGELTAKLHKLTHGEINRSELRPDLWPPEEEAKSQSECA